MIAAATLDPTATLEPGRTSPYLGTSRDLGTPQDLGTSQASSVRASVPTFRIPAPGPAVLPVAAVAPRPSRSTYLRRRLVAGLVVLFAATALVLFGEAMMAEAGGAGASTGGHAVVEPGQTLWDIAHQHAPQGTDARAYLQDIKELNGLGGEVAAWTVVLLPR